MTMAEEPQTPLRSADRSTSDQRSATRKRRRPRARPTASTSAGIIGGRVPALRARSSRHRHRRLPHVKHYADGINVNLWTGLGMLVFGALMVFWALARPAMPEPPETRGQGSGRIRRAPAT